MKNFLTLSALLAASSSIAAPLYNCELKVDDKTYASNLALPFDKEDYGIYRLPADKFDGAYIAAGWSRRSNFLSLRVLDVAEEPIAAASVLVPVELKNLPPFMEVKTMALSEKGNAASVALSCHLIK
ncbi:MAG: hypothetical protein ACJ763_16710 [Bdellovibrionia bacterium]